MLGIAGIGYKQNGQLRFNVPRTKKPLVDMPPKAYHLADFDTHEKVCGRRSHRVCRTRTTAGIARTKASTVVNGAPFRQSRSREEACELVSRCGLELLWIVDDNFLVGRERAVGIAEGIVRRGVSRTSRSVWNTSRVWIPDRSHHRARPLRGGVVETPAEVRRIAHHFRCNAGLASYVSPVCNAPWTSAVIAAGAGLRPCFFRQTIGTLKSGEDRKAILNSPSAGEFRSTLGVSSHSICRNCVCSLNWDPDGVASPNRPGSKTIYRNVTYPQHVH